MGASTIAAGAPYWSRDHGTRGRVTTSTIRAPQRQRTREKDRGATKTLKAHRGGTRLVDHAGNLDGRRPGSSLPSTMQM